MGVLSKVICAILFIGTGVGTTVAVYEMPLSMKTELGTKIAEFWEPTQEDLERLGQSVTVDIIDETDTSAGAASEVKQTKLEEIPYGEDDTSKTVSLLPGIVRKDDSCYSGLDTWTDKKKSILDAFNGWCSSTELEMGGCGIQAYFVRPDGTRAFERAMVRIVRAGPDTSPVYVDWPGSCPRIKERGEVGTFVRY